MSEDEIDDPPFNEKRALASPSRLEVYFVISYLYRMVVTQRSLITAMQTGKTDEVKRIRAEMSELSEIFNNRLDRLVFDIPELPDGD